MAKFIYKVTESETAPFGLLDAYYIELPDGSVEPILNRQANPNYVHNGRRIFLTDEQQKELRKFSEKTEAALRRVGA